ncbi:hypothetical protein WKH82_08475 [Acinetobacter baumannii]|nr:hypothetical protein [Acinetobacter baumannii]
MTSPVALQDKRNTAIAILNIIKDSFEVPTTIEEYVAELNEQSLDEIIESAARVMSKNMPELIYQLGYDVYNEAAKLRHIGVMVRTEDGCGALIQIIQDRRNSAVYKTNISRVLPFNKSVDRALIRQWINDFKEEQNKWQLLGSVATSEGVARRAILKPGKTGTYVHAYTDTRFAKFVQNENLTMMTINSWFKALDMEDNKSNTQHINVLYEILGEVEAAPLSGQYDSWGSW